MEDLQFHMLKLHLNFLYPNYNYFDMPIQHISDSMLKGKVKWEEVREKVREFIGESIIVGHNVLFDIAMLESHGIDLSRSVALDTFELSEIFSQEAESLNLGFLAEKYGFK